MSLRKIGLFPWILAVFLIIASISQAVSAELPGLPSDEFARLIRELSEDGGYFFSDNFISSEDSYLTILDKLKELGAGGGAYIGVGPEQNFTYIAKIRPQIAFIVDIRRQAMIQHLMYKAIFHLSPTRAQFLSYLLSRPLPADKIPSADVSLDEMLSLVSDIRADDKAYAKNLAAIRKSIQEEFHFPLSAEDQESLEFVYRSFRDWGFQIGMTPGMRRGRGGGRGFGGMPDLMQILSMKDLKGKQGNFLAGTNDYNFVREMQRKNLIIPVVGDFSGKKALASVGAYLRKRGLTVSVFYVSNVEIVLLDWGSYEQFSEFAKNVKKLPADDRSLMIRSTFSYYGHPERLPGYTFCTMLQKISVFLKDFDAGRYKDYYDLIMTHYIGRGKP
ncbi:MAG: hypothetical protein JXA73_09295 [Acidobacteria bacterium]|nr:hypothetical protein [Acidobacteriota bacterium]